MKLFSRIFIYMLLGTAPVVCFAQTEAAHKPFTLKECVSTAIQQNRSILMSKENVKAASGKVIEAKSAGNPKFNLFGSASDRSNEEDIPLAVGIGENQNLIIQNVPLVPNSSSSAGVALTQVIDISGLIHTGTQVAHLGEESARLDVCRVQNDVVLQTTLLYYDVLRNEELVGVAQEAMKNAQTRKDTAQALVDTGISSKVDVIRAEASISAAQQQIITARNAVQVSKSALNRILGREINSPIELVKPDETTLKVTSYEDCLSEALTNRPEVAMAARSKDISEKRYKLAKKGMSPSFVMSAAARIDSAYDCDPDDNSSVGLSLIFPLSDGGETDGRKKQAAADIQSSQIAEDETKAQIELQVKSAYVHVQNAGEKLATANKELDQATESLRLSRTRYEEGITGQVELSDAELLFTQAQTNVVNARFELFGSQAELERALGRYVNNI